MKALTVYQPYASLIVAGAKPYEFRGHRAPQSIIGQRIVIHAAAHKMDEQEVIRMFVAIADRAKSEDHARAAAETCLIPEPALDVLQRAWAPGGEAPLPMAAGIGSAIVGEPRPGIEIAEELGLTRANDSDRDHYAAWAWPMLEVERWASPISMRGQQGLWNWPPPAP